MSGLYFDHNATTPISERAIERMSEVFAFGPLNPSSAHRSGRQARAILDQARSEVAFLVGTDPETVTFTSGATEASHIVLESLRSGSLQGRRLVLSEGEHSAIREAALRLRASGVPVSFVPLDSDGVIDLGALGGALRERNALVAVQWANNETGVVQPVQQVIKLASEADSLVLIDATQAVGKTEVSLAQTPAHFLAFSSHKIGGPQGAGALVTKNRESLGPRLPGGGQEWGLRPGTENIPAIAAFGAAALERAFQLASWIDRATAIRDRFEHQLESRDAVSRIHGKRAPRLPNTSSVQFRDVDGEALMLQLVGRGIACSQGSACRSNRPEPSYVLLAMGIAEAAAWASLRFSFSASNTVDEVDEAVDVIEDAIRQLESFHSVRLN